MFNKTLRLVFYRTFTPLAVAILRLRGVQVGKYLTLYGFPQLHRHPGSEITIGGRVVLCSDSGFTALALYHPVKISTMREGARITIGSDVGISGACIVSANDISIGSEVLIGANVLIVDTDFHPISPLNRRHSDDASNILTAPVKIGDNVFVGANATVLKGVSIGNDSIVAAGAVVTSGEYPAGAVLAGIPARQIGNVYSK